MATTVPGTRAGDMPDARTGLLAKQETQQRVVDVQLPHPWMGVPHPWMGDHILTRGSPFLTLLTRFRNSQLFLARFQTLLHPF